MIEEANGNNTINVKLSSPSSVIPITSSTSNDNLSLSQSASEYTDADGSMSAPTEYLAEFLSAVMQKDYRKALKYCKLILDFEPNNVTAKEFYPLIEEKMRNEFTYDLVDVSSDSDGGSDDSDDYSAAVENQSDSEEKYSVDSNKSSTSTSNSSLFASDLSLCDSNSSNANQANSFAHSAQPFGESENTTHSYSNSLLEDEDDIEDSDCDNVTDDEQYKEDAHLLPNLKHLHLSDLNNGNYQPTSLSDSESPSEPLTLKIRANFRLD